MCDKSLKGVQELKQIIRTASKDDIDKEALGAKLNHMEEKLEDLKGEIVKQNQIHKKEIKVKDKEIRKAKEAERQLEEKLEQSRLKSKNSDSHKHRQHHYASGDKSDSTELADRFALERETRKKREAQQETRECKKQIEELKRMLAERDRENQRLKEDMEVQRLLLDAFMNQRSQCSSDHGRNSEIEEEDPNAEEEVHLHKNEPQMMDLSEGRGYSMLNEEESEPRKLSEDKQTDDQQDDESDEYLQKMISHASQQQQEETPSLKAISSLETENEGHENQQDIMVMSGSKAWSTSENSEQSSRERKEEWAAETKESQQKETEAEGEGERSKSWSIWSFWFKKSK